MKRILIYNSGGGLGDSIQLIQLILSLQNHFKRSKFFYLGAHENHFNKKLKEYNIKIDTLDLGLKYIGFRWWHLFLIKKKIKDKNVNKFDLIIDLQTKFRNSLILKKIPHINFYSITLNSMFSTKKMKLKSKNHLENLNVFFEENIKVVNFDCKRLPKFILKEAKNLLPKTNYVGFSITQGNKYRKKSWSIYKFITLANKVLIKNKIPETNSELSCPALVTALSSRLDQAVSIDNGVMHMMALADIPMVVLFGPTNSEKFAPKNNYIKILDSKKTHGTSDINSISVEEVYELI